MSVEHIRKSIEGAVKVTVDSESDDRGLLGMDDTIQTGPLSMRTRIQIGAEGVSEEKLRGIVKMGRAPFARRRRHLPSRPIEDGS